jgi:hypothetical protein
LQDGHIGFGSKIDLRVIRRGIGRQGDRLQRRCARTQAQMTLQQQIANNLTFTYVTALDNANATTIQAVWTLTPQWSAVATRDQNGIFSVNLLYKRQIR